MGTYTAQLKEGLLSGTPIPVSVEQCKREVPSLKLKAAPQSELTGRIIVPAGEQIGTFTMTLKDSEAGTVLVVSPPPAILDAKGGLMIVPIQADGTFSARLPAGNYRVSAIKAPPQFAVKSAVSGATNLLRDTLKIEARKAPPEILVTLGPR
jgi:hypothetical protein